MVPLDLQLLQIDTQLLGFQVGGSAAIGALIGFFAKKVAKVIAFIVGAELMLFKFLESKGILSVRWDRLTAGIVKAGEQGKQAATGWVETFVSTAGIGVGFAGGFYLGFRKA